MLKQNEGIGHQASGTGKGEGVAGAGGAGGGAGFACPKCKAPTEVVGTKKHASQVIRYRRCREGHACKTRSVIVKDPKNPKIEVRRTPEEVAP